jgi:hypothetical protein
MEQSLQQTPEPQTIQQQTHRQYNLLPQILHRQSILAQMLEQQVFKPAGDTANTQVEVEVPMVPVSWNNSSNGYSNSSNNSYNNLVLPYQI